MDSARSSGPHPSHLGALRPAPCPGSLDGYGQLATCAPRPALLPFARRLAPAEGGSSLVLLSCQLPRFKPSLHCTIGSQTHPRREDSRSPFRHIPRRRRRIGRGADRAAPWGGPSPEPPGRPRHARCSRRCVGIPRSASNPDRRPPGASRTTSSASFGTTLHGAD